MSLDHENEIDLREDQRRRPDVYWLLSGIYCMILVILSIVICSSHYNTPDVSELAVDVYFVILTLIGSVWLLAFRSMATSCGNNEDHEDVKSTHSTNRWLKGILLIFGVAIVIKDVLEVLTTTQYSEAKCKRVVYFLAPISEMFFIITQVNFLFRYSKLHFQRHTTFNRFGAMHVIATNLSIWVLIIIDESMPEQSSGPTPTVQVTTSQTSPIATLPAEFLECNMTEILELQNRSLSVGINSLERSFPSSYASEQIFGPDDCYCNTSYCKAVSTSHTYLYPFLVEFSLVASCMIYIVWKNIGKKPRHTTPPPKPSFKFYKSYKGMAVGVVIMIVTTVVLIFANYGIESAGSGGYYDDQITTVITFNGFMVGTETLMLISCFVGVALYRAEPRELDVSFNLDTVLLLVTLAGVFVLDMYYTFAVIVSLISDNYDYKWIWGVIYPILDLIQCVIQVGFILGGSARRPVVIDDIVEDVENIEPHFISESTDSGIHSGYKNEVFESTDNDEPLEKAEAKDAERAMEAKTVDVKLVEPQLIKECAAFQPNNDYRKRRSTRRSIEAKALEERIRQHKLRPRVAPPSLVRLYIRDTLMFLLICNACLWMFWSLEGPSIKRFAYPNQYFANSVSGTRNLWARATMFCLPLAIFFRMHSCACLFEMWSFT